MNKGEGIDIAILHLAIQGNHNKDFDFYFLLKELSIPDGIHKFVFQTMFHRGYIDGLATIKDPIIHVTKKGLQYADELKEKYFQEHGKPLNPDNPIVMQLDETCEKLFQMHKNENFKILWTKSTYDNMPSNLDVAKELLLSRGILYQKVSSGGHRYTHLHPDFYKTKSCKEAFEFMAEQNKPKPNILIDYSITTHGPNSPAAGKELSFNQTNNPDPVKKKWYQKWVDEFIKNTVQYLVTGIIAFSIGLLSGKGCNQADSLMQSKSTNSKSLDSIPPDSTLKVKK